MASAEMTFWDHLDELRGVLIRMAAVIIVAAICFFCLMPQIFDTVILAPCHGSFPLYSLFDRMAQLAGDAGAGADAVSGAVSGGGSAPDGAASASGSGDFSVTLINTQLASQFFIHLSLSFQLAIVATFPLLVYLLWTFVAPALYPAERRHATTAFLCGNLLFYTGMLTGYFLIFPLTLRFLAGYQLSADIPNTITLDSYMDNFISILLVMGLTFEIPLLTWILGRMGLITRSFFSHYRRHAIVILVILAAVITPTSDPFTLTAVFLPLYLLWELSARLLKP